MSKELRVFLIKYAKEMQATQDFILSTSNCDAVEHEAIYEFYEMLEKLLCDEANKFKSHIWMGLTSLDVKSLDGEITGETLKEAKRQMAHATEFARLIIIMSAFE